MVLRRLMKDKKDKEVTNEDIRILIEALAVSFETQIGGH